MKWKIRMQQTSNKKQTIISQRLAEEPYADAGFYVAIFDGRLILGTGLLGTNETIVGTTQCEELEIDIYSNCVSLRWGENADEFAGMHFNTPVGDTLHLGRDPQAPGTDFEGEIKLVG